MSNDPNQNPYAQSAQPGVPPTGYGSGDPQRAMGKVNPPAIALMVVGVINLMLSLWGVASSALFMAGVGPMIEAQQQQAQQMEQLREQGMEGFAQFMQVMSSMQGPAGLAIGLVQILAAGFIIYGGLKMKKLQSYGIALGAAVVAMVPILSNCCCVGLPIGIWGLVVLMDQNVKQSFR